MDKQNNENGNNDNNNKSFNYSASSLSDVQTTTEDGNNNNKNNNNDNNDDYDNEDEDEDDNEEIDIDISQAIRPGYIANGACFNSKQYNHSYLTCDTCKVGSGISCSIPDCPCNGVGVIFLINEEQRLYAHEIVGHEESVRVYINRPTRARERVKKSIEKHERRMMRKQSLSKTKTNTNTNTNTDNGKDATQSQEDDDITNKKDKLKESSTSTTTISQSSLVDDGQNASASSSLTIPDNVYIQNDQTITLSPFAIVFNNDQDETNGNEGLDQEIAMMLNEVLEESPKQSTKKTKQDKS